MKKCFDKNPETLEAMKRAMKFLLPEDADVTFANVDSFRQVYDEQDLAMGIPVIFYGVDSEIDLRLRGHDAAPWFYSKNAAYFQVPFELSEMILMHEKIKKGEKIENKAVMIATKFKYRQSLVGQLLHDIYPGKFGCEKGIKRAERELGITGSVEEVRAQLIKLQDKTTGAVCDAFGGEIVPGVFCDVEGTLISNDRKTVNAFLIEALELLAKNDAVTLWTGGDVGDIAKTLFDLGIHYPVVSKETFRGCKVRFVYDDLPKKEFQKQYGIFAVDYIQNRDVA